MVCNLKGTAIPCMLGMIWSSDFRGKYSFVKHEQIQWIDNEHMMIIATQHSPILKRRHDINVFNRMLSCHLIVTMAVSGWVIKVVDFWSKALHHRQELASDAHL